MEHKLCFLTFLLFVPQKNNVIGCLVAWLIAAGSAHGQCSDTYDEIDVLPDKLVEVVREIVKTDQLSIILMGFQLFIPVSCMSL